jgi:hypothetical protein
MSEEPILSKITDSPEIQDEQIDETTTTTNTTNKSSNELIVDNSIIMEQQGSLYTFVSNSDISIDKQKPVILKSVLHNTKGPIISKNVVKKNTSIVSRGLLKKNNAI